MKLTDVVEERPIARFTIESQSETMTAVGKQTRRLTEWASVEWRPKDLPPTASRHPTDLEVLRATFGLDVTLATIWEALPWSWLIDYFTTMGDYLGAHRNTVPASYDRICVMQHQRTESVYTMNSSTFGGTWGGATEVYEFKRRTRHSNLLLPTAYLPMLGLGQLSILGSLAILKGKSLEK